VNEDSSQGREEMVNWKVKRRPHCCWSPKDEADSGEEEGNVFRQVTERAKGWR
jgi:hypothetical protein